jgi:predicted DCC family thiol-disulfide oxidoreductase YuxK
MPNKRVKKQGGKAADDSTRRDRAEVLYDGECAMCSNLALRINETDAVDSLATNDLRHARLPQGVTAEAVTRELHVIEADGRITRGADAVLRILEEYPRWRWLARIGSSRAAKPFTAMGYRFVATNRDHIFGPGARLFWSKEILLVALLAAIATAPMLWVSKRAYPVVPVLTVLPVLLEIIALAVMTFGAAAALVLPKPRGALALLLGGAVVLALGDQTRWQPWFYQYTIMLSVLTAWSWRPNDLKASLEPLAALRVVMIGLYAWSGIQKLNATYLSGTFGWLVEPLGALLPATWVESLSVLGAASPAAEIAIAVGLLFPATRPWATAAAVALHAFILAMLGPWAHNWNSIVWPWNGAMIALVVVLFASDRDTRPAAILGTPISVGRAVAIAAFIVLPALSLVDRWDPYLSSSLYSRNLRHAAIRLRSDARQALPADLQPYADDEDVLWPMTWALDALNVPAYPAVRVYKGLARAVCRQLPDPTGLILGISSKPEILTGEFTVTDYHCEDLQ